MNPEAVDLVNSSSGHPADSTAEQSCTGENKCLTIALAGNANVGKSAIFNQLTGLVQETGNWHGKTVGIREGKLLHHGRNFKIVDLPGIYSFSSYSQEEQITREYILTQHPDIVINVVDATSLERNLCFTLQLKEMNTPVIIAMNFADIAEKKHIRIDNSRLNRILDSPVVSTMAIKGIGVHELVDVALDIIDKKDKRASVNHIKYGPEVEARIEKLNRVLVSCAINYPRRWSAIKLLEGDNEILAGIERQDPEIIGLSRTLSDELAGIHGEDCASVITSERYALAGSIAREITSGSGLSTSLSTRFDNISLHPVTGYILLLAVMVAILLFISFFGGWLTDLITKLFISLNPQDSGPLADIIWNGLITGLYASLSVALGFILPFYLILGWLGESGYLPRIAFLMDRPCHTIGLHGQASLPFILALGCNVPACLSCRIMDNRRDRIISTFLSTIVPCSARTSVILGLVGAFVGWQWAVGLLVFQFAFIFFIGRILNKINPSTSPGIIMEIPEYRLPSLKIVWSQAWYRFKDFLTIGVPLIIAGSVVIESLRIFNLLDNLTQALTPLTVTWLGLPAFAGVLLIFGILRKEANLALLIAFAGGAQLTAVITPLQMIIFSIVIMLYIPCISTIAVLVKETGFRITLAIVTAEIILALLVGGLAYRLLGIFFG
jgi:ferrous iron transport protein B